MSFQIVTDTSANLPSAYAAEHGITVIPLTCCIGGQDYECTDTDHYDFETYYTKIKSGLEVTTSQINPQKYTDYLEPILKSGDDVLFVGMSSGISGSFASAKIAAEDLEETFPNRKIELVDSLAASLGEGRLVMQAVALQKAGLCLQEAAQKLTELRKKICQIFTVDDLLYLRKGGRLSNATAIIGTLLNIKPLLKGNEDGKIVSNGKVRGRKAVIQQLVEKYETLVVDAVRQTVAISHCHCVDDANQLANLLRHCTAPPKDILIMPHEPVTGSYLGPGALALYFDGDEQVRLK